MKTGVSVGLLCSVAAIAFATPDLLAAEKGSPHGLPFEIGLEGQIGRGETSWKVDIYEFMPGVGEPGEFTEAKWKDMEHVSVGVNTVIRVHPMFRVGGSFALGEIRGGMSRHLDAFDQNAPEYSGLKMLQAEGDVRGDTAAYTIDGYLRVNEVLKNRNIPGAWDLVLGYQFYEEDLEERNLVHVVDFNERINQPLPDVHTAFELQWRAVRVGVRGEYPLSEKWYARGSAIALVAVDYSGRGEWEYGELRHRAPEIRQNDHSGFGSELKGSILYSVSEKLFAEAGYNFLRMKSSRGADRSFLPDGTEIATVLDQARFDRHAFFVGVGASF